MAAWKGAKIFPVWNPALEQLTGKSLAEVEPFFKHIFDFYSQAFPANQSKI